MTESKTGKYAAAGFLIGLSLIPWILYGLHGPMSDADMWLACGAEKFGLMKANWHELLYTVAPALFLAPLLYLFHSYWFYWVSSSILALTSVAATFLVWKAFKDIFRHSWVAYVGAILFAFHPFIHQMHFYWMTELGYITGLLLGLYYLSRSWGTDSLKPLILSSVWIMFARFFRPQTDLVFPIGIAFVAFQALYIAWPRRPSLEKLARHLAAFILPAFLISMPFRLLNHHYFDTWILSKTIGNGAGFFLEAGGFDYRNGPESARMRSICEEVLKNPQDPRTTGFLPWERDHLRDQCVSLVVDNKCHYFTPMWIYYWASRDWQASQDEVGKVVVEAIRARPKQFIRWVVPQARWYFGGKSENPTEWQDNFYSTVVNYKWRIDLDGFSVASRQTPILAAHFPIMLRIYNPLRTVYAHSATVLKKLTVLSLPFLLWLTWMNKEQKNFFLVLLVFSTQFVSSMALAILVGFHHRYAIPFEGFTILYLCLWLDRLAGVSDRGSNQKARGLRGSSFPTEPRAKEESVS